MPRSEQWNVSLNEVLADHVWEYARARGDPAARLKVLKECERDLVSTVSCEEDGVIELPELLTQVSISFH